MVSDVRLSTRPLEDGVTVPSAAADVLLGLDLLSAASRSNLRVADRERTIAVVSDSLVPTAPMIVDADAPRPDASTARAAIDGVTCAADNVYLDAQRLAQRLLGDATAANVLVLGACWQAGALPVSIGSLQQAFRLNGVAVEQNLAALAWGRAWVVDPEAVRAEVEGAPAAARLSRRDEELLDRAAPDQGELRRLLGVRLPDLRDWGDARVAGRLADQVARVRRIEAERVPGSTALAEEVARNLYKLLAYKDEYEVARLHLQGLSSLPPGSKVKIHLHPPLLRAMGLKRKLRLGRWFTPMLRALRLGRRLRGTPFDPFGYAKVRRVERELPGEYLALLDLALERLAPETLERALEVARLPELVRGYEEIKLRSVQRFRARAGELRTELGA